MIPRQDISEFKQANQVRGKKILKKAFSSHYYYHCIVSKYKIWELGNIQTNKQICIQLSARNIIFTFE